MASHSHNHTEHSVNAPVRTLYVCLAINLLFVAAEAFAGWKSNSAGLMSDAGHNLSDALGLLLSLVAIYMNRTESKAGQAVSGYVTLANGLTAWLLMKGQRDDININAGSCRAESRHLHKDFSSRSLTILAIHEAAEANACLKK